MLDYAINVSKDKLQPMQFLNRLLSVYHNKGIKTVSEAKQEKIEFENYYKKSDSQTNKASKTEYSKEQLSSLFDTINEVELWLKKTKRNRL